MSKQFASTWPRIWKWLKKLTFWDGVCLHAERWQASLQQVFDSSFTNPKFSPRKAKWTCHPWAEGLEDRQMPTILVGLTSQPLNIATLDQAQIGSGTVTLLTGNANVAVAAAQAQNPLEPE